MRLIVPLLGLLLTASLFIGGMATLPLWQDEGWTIVSSEVPLGAWPRLFAQDNHPPLFMLILRLYRPWVGESFFALRTLGFFISLLSVALVYRLGRELFNARAALVALLVFASHDFILTLDSAVRQYNLYILLAVLSTWVYWRYTRPHARPLQQRAWGAAYALASLALLYSLYWGFFILLAQACHALLYQRRRFWARFLPIAAFVGLAYAPWLPILADQTLGNTSFMGSAGGFRDGLPLTRDGFDVMLYQVFGVPEAFFILFAIGGVFGALTHFHPDSLRPTEATTLAALWWLVPLGLPLLITLAGFDLFVTSPMTGVVAAFALLIGHAVSQWRGGLYVVMLTFLLVNNLTTWSVRSDFRGPWWEVADFVAQNRAPQDAVVLESKDWQAFALGLHLRAKGLPQAAILRSMYIRRGVFSETQTDLRAALAPYRALWLGEVFREEDLRPLLAELGYQATTPDFSFNAASGAFPTLFARYALPPQGATLANFGGQLWLDEMALEKRAGRLDVGLTWHVENTPPADYTVSVFLLAEDGRLATQQDSYPMGGASPTSTWVAGRWYYDAHSLPLQAVPAGRYQVAVKVYTWWDGAILPLEACSIPPCDYWLWGALDL